MKYPLLVAFCALTFACDRSAVTAAEKPAADKPAAVVDKEVGRVEKSNDEWKREMTPLQYNVMREKGTERSGTGKDLDNHDKGTFVCSACGLSLFASDTKFESGTGWPSFWKPIKPSHVKEIVDKDHGMTRTEVVCARCDGHLGHVFDDGPKPTGLRYCMNSISLKFVPADKTEKSGDPAKK
jgi:peptide-methionine (R)-S-oxide reductase